jgi:hypothetical protein
MPKNTTDEFFKNALTELEQIVQQLELEEDLAFSECVDEADELLSSADKKNLLATERPLRSGQPSQKKLESFTDE